MPSAAEIEAYLEQSAARTKLRLPLAKGNALPAPLPAGAAPLPAGAAPPAVPAERVSQAGGGPPAPAKRLPVERAGQRRTEPAAPPPAGETADGWTPFADDE